MTFTPPNPANYIPGNFPNPTLQVRGTINGKEYIYIVQAGATFSSPVGADPAKNKLEAQYFWAESQFKLDVGFASFDETDQVIASSWFFQKVGQVYYGAVT
jgi:hypothetical protein